MHLPMLEAHVQMITSLLTMPPCAKLALLWMERDTRTKTTKDVPTAIGRGVDVLLTLDR